MYDNVQYINSDNARPAQGLYSHLTKVKAGNLYYISWQLFVGSDGAVMGKEDFDAQFSRVFKNFGDVLAARGCNYNDVVKFNSYLTASQHIDNFMKTGKRCFPHCFLRLIMHRIHSSSCTDWYKEDFSLKLKPLPVLVINNSLDCRC